MESLFLLKEEEYQQEIHQFQERKSQLEEELEEKNEKIIFAESEIERTLLQCNQAIVRQRHLFTHLSTHNHLFSLIILNFILFSLFPYLPSHCSS